MSALESSRALRDWLLAQPKRPTREEMARRYAGLLALPVVIGATRELNRAIERRWSPNGLDWIKRRAWQLIESGSVGAARGAGR